MHNFLAFFIVAPDQTSSPRHQQTSAYVTMASGTVVGQVNYLKKLPLYQKEKPFQLFVPIDPDDPDQRATNLEFEPRECTFHDINDASHDLSLDKHGIQIVRCPTKVDLPSFRDRGIVESIYFDEVEHILKNIEGGYDRVLIFDWRVRNTF